MSFFWPWSTLFDVVYSIVFGGFVESPSSVRWTIETRDGQTISHAMLCTAAHFTAETYHFFAFKQPRNPSTKIKTKNDGMDVFHRCSSDYTSTLLNLVNTPSVVESWLVTL